VHPSGSSERRFQAGEGSHRGNLRRAAGSLSAQTTSGPILAQTSQNGLMEPRGLTNRESPQTSMVDSVRSGSLPTVAAAVSASHAGGRWFDPSCAHQEKPRSGGVFHWDTFRYMAEIGRFGTVLEPSVLQATLSGWPTSCGSGSPRMSRVPTGALRFALAARRKLSCSRRSSPARPTSSPTAEACRRQSTRSCPARVRPRRGLARK
jgi:hypothetical protein